MVIQNIVFPDSSCAQDTIYFHTDGKVNPEDNTVFLNKGEYFSAYAYINVLDIGFWKKYTDVRDITLRLFTVGKGELKIYIKKEEGTEVFKELSYGAGQTDIDLGEVKEGLVYFSVTAEEPSCFLKAFYSSEIRKPNEVKIAAACAGINGRLKEVSEKLGGSLFFGNKKPYCGNLKVYSEEGDSPDGVFDTLLFRIRQDYENFPCTHTVFMTDEGDFCEEGFYRLFAFLSTVKEEYKDRPVSGRIFYSENRSVIYGGAEKWDNTQALHTDGGLDVSLPEGIKPDKEPFGDYGLWRLCAYPADYSLKERPFLFYRGFADAEYGLRSSSKPLVLRGFEAWGGSFEKEKTPEDIYYEVRSAFVLNMTEKYEADAFFVLEKWNEKYKFYKEYAGPEERYCCALALAHAARPGIFRKRSGRAPEKSFAVLNRKKLVKPAAVLLKGAAAAYIYIGYSFFRDRYIEIRREQRWQ